MSESSTAVSFPLTVARAYVDIGVSADLKACPEDFQVYETLGFELSGEGEHLCLYVQKRGLTTSALISDLAKMLGCKVRDIGYCGLKDKQALTEQWVSVHWPIQKALPDLDELQGPSWRVLKAERHSRKLKRGVHQGNRFVLRLTQLQGDVECLQQRLQQVSDHGVPNYFGEQRFGHEGRNVDKALAIFERRFKCKPAQRSMYYSAARSYLFNQYLSLRVEADNWHRALAGDVYNLQGSRSIFGPVDEDVTQRLLENDIHPVGPLLGRGELPQKQDALAGITTITNQYTALYEGLLQAGVDLVQRPLRLLPESLCWEMDEQSCQLSFSLPPGAYATAVVREIVNVNESIW